MDNIIIKKVELQKIARDMYIAFARSLFEIQAGRILNGIAAIQSMALKL